MLRRECADAKRLFHLMQTRRRKEREYREAKRELQYRIAGLEGKAHERHLHYFKAFHVHPTKLAAMDAELYIERDECIKALQDINLELLACYDDTTHTLNNVYRRTRAIIFSEATCDEGQSEIRADYDVDRTIKLMEGRYYSEQASNDRSTKEEVERATPSTHR